MTTRNTDQWRTIVSSLDYAFQPIVNIHTGVCLGHEALLRGWHEAGFESIQDVFDAACREEALFTVELLLREKAIGKFAAIQNHYKLKLFFNIDNRVLLIPDYGLHATAAILQQHDISPDSVCFELSEKHELNCFTDTGDALDSYKKQAYKIAIDDFGTGYSGLQLLYQSEPDYIKIDRFFIAGIETDSKKKLFVGKVLNLAHTLGVMVIAEGVETEKEYYFCKEIGCDYVQGYFVQQPATDIHTLKDRYERVGRLNISDRRKKSLDHILLHEQMEYLEPIHLHTREKGYFTDMSTVFERFRTHKEYSFFPIINGNDEPVGLIRESDLKEYVYSRYGKDLLLNKAAGRTLADFIVKAPISDINTKIEKILECFALDKSSEGVLLSESGRYIGFLSAKSLLHVINEKNITVARDQNPLTRLAGNTMIGEFLEEILEDVETSYIIIYYDFDHFKAFNDKYGFRQGDRAILLFSDILKKASAIDRFFIGHIGGDDFFCAFKVGDLDACQIHKRIRHIAEKFSNDVLSMYDLRDRQQGFIVSIDRDGTPRNFPLLTVSAAILNIPEREQYVSLEQIGTIIADLKKSAKRSSNKVAISTLKTHNSGSPLAAVGNK